MEALSVLDGGCEPLCDLNRIVSGALGVSEDVEPCAWRDGERFLLVADRRFAEDFPSDIEGELCSKGDRIVVGRGRKGEFVGLTGRRFVRSVQHMALVRSWEGTFLFVPPPLLSCRG